MIVRSASDLDVLLVTRNMRALNREEAEAMRGEFKADALARELNNLFASVGKFRHAYLAPSREPVAVLALYEIPGPPGRCVVHLIATEKWPSIAREAYRHMRTAVVPIFFRLHGALTVGTDVLDRGLTDRKWLRALGFADDGPPRPIGRNGEMFQRVVWRAPIDDAGGVLRSVSATRSSTHV